MRRWTNHNSTVLFYDLATYFNFLLEFVYILHHIENNPSFVFLFSGLGEIETDPLIVCTFRTGRASYYHISALLWVVTFNGP